MESKKMYTGKQKQKRKEWYKNGKKPEKINKKCKKEIKRLKVIITKRNKGNRIREKRTGFTCCWIMWEMVKRGTGAHLSCGLNLDFWHPLTNLTHNTHTDTHTTHPSATIISLMPFLFQNCYMVTSLSCWSKCCWHLFRGYIWYWCNPDKTVLVDWKRRDSLNYILYKCNCAR